LPQNEFFHDGGQYRLACVVVDHVDDLSPVGVGQLMEVIAEFLFENILGDMHALRGDVLERGLVVLVVEDLKLVLV
jgi:hypothetical protein